MQGTIYGIFNNVNPKVYVGKTERTLDERWAEHIEDSVKRPHLAPLLYRAIRKYGIEAFTVKVIDRAIDRHDLDVAERLWIWYYQSATKEHGYNLTLGGTGGKPNAATLEKLHQPKSALHKRHCSEAAKRRTPEVIARMQAAANTLEARNRKSVKLKDRKFSNETKLKMAASAKARVERERSAGKDHLAKARDCRRPLLRDIATGHYVAQVPDGGTTRGRD